MKTVLYFFTIVTILLLNSCKGPSVKESKSDTGSTKTSAPVPAASTASPAGTAPALTINEADWELKDLSKIAKYINISMKVPKSAKVEQQTEVGIVIRLSPYYTINIASRAESSIKDAMEFDKAPIKDTANKNRKVLKEESNGMIFTFQIPDESNGTKYEPEVHFTYYVGQPGNLYAISDDFSSADTTNTVNGSYYSEDVANKVYAIIKSSAKVNQ
ncbi:MAG: hypothetical protein ACLQQ4_16650 [Bacteroidia bacterium]